MTDEEGRASAFLTWEDFSPGSYRAHFDTLPYYRLVPPWTGV